MGRIRSTHLWIFIPCPGRSKRFRARPRRSDRTLREAAGELLPKLLPSQGCGLAKSSPFPRKVHTLVEALFFFWGGGLPGFWEKKASFSGK